MGMWEGVCTSRGCDRHRKRDCHCRNASARVKHGEREEDGSKDVDGVQLGAIPASRDFLPGVSGRLDANVSDELKSASGQ